MSLVSVTVLAVIASAVLMAPSVHALTYYDDPLTSSQVKIQSGTGSFVNVTADTKQIFVRPGEALNGTVTMGARNGLASTDNAVLIGTPSWGDASSSYWNVSENMLTGLENYTSDINLTAPSAEGTYYIIFAFNAEHNGTSVASCTSYRYFDLTGTYSWNDGNDVATLTAEQVAQMNTVGRTTVTYRHADATHWWDQAGWTLPGDAIQVVVTDPSHYPSPFTGSYIKMASGTGSFAKITSSYKQITVEPGKSIVGTLSLNVKNDLVGSNAPLVGTPSWGDPQNSYWTVQPSVSMGTNVYPVGEHPLTAPSAEGTYYIIFALSGEPNGEWVASLTDSAVGTQSWNDEENLANMSSSQVAQAQSTGRTSLTYLFDTGYQQWAMPVDVVKVVVDAITQYNDTLSNSTVRIQSGTGTFADLSPSNKVVQVHPGDALTGSVTMTTKNDLAPTDWTPLIATTSWGSHSTSFWTVNSWISTGETTNAASGISLYAPTEPGTYYLIFAFNAEMNGAEVASCTNWRYVDDHGSVVWDDTNDLAGLTKEQIDQAQAIGSTKVIYTFQSWNQQWTVPADAITINVSALPEGFGTLTGKVVDSSNATPMPQVMVSLNIGGTTFTMDDGTFSINLTEGSYNITLNKSGYKDKQVSQVTVTPGNTTQLGEIVMVVDGGNDPPMFPTWVPLAFIGATAVAVVALLVIRRSR
jgi:hypothetical protein